MGAILRAAAGRDGGDFIIFAVERASEIADDTPGAVRFLVRAELAGRIFEEIRVDVAFGDPLVGDPELVKGPGSLQFAGIKAPAIATLPLEQHVAEKVHAYTRTYGEGKTSTRPKDLIHLVMIGSFAKFDADQLRKAFEQIFTARGTHSLPAALPEPPSDWRTPYRRMAGEVGLDRDLLTGHRLAARMVDPVLKNSVVIIIVVFFLFILLIMHDLRHVHNTTLMREGVNPKIVKERAGHHSVAFTLEQYSWATPDLQEVAVEALTRSLAGPPRR